MNQAKLHLPLPTHFRSFKSINEVEDNYVFNEELQYILKSGFTIVSIGLHSRDRMRHEKEKEKGKTDFLSKVFLLDMVLEQNRHNILKGCPFLYVNIFENTYPLNIIDIPSG